MLRVLHVDTGREMGGGQYQVLFLLRGLRDLGHEVKLLAPAHSPLRQYSDLPWEPLTVARLRQPADLVHAHDSRGHTLGLASGKPVVVSRRVAFARRPGLVSRIKYQSATRFLAVSGFVRDLLAAEGVANSRIAVVPDGVPLLPVSSYAGGVIALEKSRSLLGDFPVPVTYPTQLEDALSSAKLMVYLSPLEGLGSGALLAQSAGVPVIVNRAGGLPETIIDGETGFIADPRDPAAIVALIHRLSRDLEETKQFGLRARLRIQEQFSVQRMVARTLEQYRVVLNGSDS
jgi:glycosyltransferase involved in cell wall biosynthesis